MNKALQEQLLKAGLIDQKKAKAVNAEQRKQKKQQPKGQAIVDETKAAAQKAVQEKADRDRELNRQRQAEAEQKALKAQVKQIIETNAQDFSRGETSYQFADGKLVKKIYVSDQQHDHLSRGLLAIARLGEKYYVIPARIAQKIEERDASAIVALHQCKDSDQAEGDDFYAAYTIPDDLMW